MTVFNYPSPFIFTFHNRWHKGSLSV